MKFYVLIFLLLIFVCTTSKIILNKSNQSTQAISEVINELFIKDNIKYDTIIYGKFSPHLKKVFNSLKSRNIIEESLIVHIKNLKDEHYFIYKQALYLTDSLVTAEKLLIDSVLFNKFPINLRFLIYIEGENVDINKIFYSEFYSKKIGHLTQFVYFITRNNGELKLN